MPPQPKIYRLSAPLGTALWVDEQLYNIVGFAPFTRVRGDVIQEPVWETTCPRCRQKFRIQARGTRTILNRLQRRCPNCIQPGVKVASEDARVEVAKVDDVSREIILKFDLGIPAPRGLKGRRFYSDHGQAEERAAWRVLHEASEGRISPIECRKIIGEWVARGWLVRKKYLDPVTRREQTGLVSGL